MNILKLFLEAKLREYVSDEELAALNAADREAALKANAWEMEFDRKKGSEIVPMEKKYKEMRGFIDPSGKIIEIGDEGHLQYSMKLGYQNDKKLGMANGWIRWSPETDAFSVYLTMTREQIETIRDILSEYGYWGLTIEYLNKMGQRQVIGFADHNPSGFDTKIEKIQASVNNKKIGKPIK